VKNPGKRRYFKLRDIQAFGNQRAHLATQAGLGEVSQSVSDLEQGGRCQERTAGKICAKLSVALKAKGVEKNVDQLFDELFEVDASIPGRDFFTWEHLEQGAEYIGGRIFKRDDGFYPDAVLTFSGPSAIFASLTMTVALPREKLFLMPTYLAMWMDAGAGTPAVPGFTLLPGNGFFVLMPEALTRDPQGNMTRKLAILDDSITTGLPYQVLRRDLVKQFNYKRKNIKVACCVWYEGTSFLRKIMPDTKPDEFKFPTPTNNFRFPWGPAIYLPEDVTDEEEPTIDAP